jgi:hypothetical protein
MERRKSSRLAQRDQEETNYFEQMPDELILKVQHPVHSFIPAPPTFTTLSFSST